jgi:hypothetical protein
VLTVRPEKAQAKQIEALAELLRDHPEYRAGDKAVRLTLMGGTRNQEDKDRASGLRRLATKLGVEVSRPSNDRDRLTIRIMSSLSRTHPMGTL